MRDAGPEWRRVYEGEVFCGFRRKDLPHDRPGHHSANGNADPPKDWAVEAAKYAKELTPERRAALAANLELPNESIGAVDGIGYAVHAEKDDAGNWLAAWTFPERDGAGRIVGLDKRFADGRKGFFKGGRRGLILSAGWREKPGPILLVEGASDVLALTLCGLSCIGRPSNDGGADDLARLLKGIDRDVLIVAENDAKPDGSWPGRDGAYKIAKALDAALGKPVGVAAPPEGIKDARVWFHEIMRGRGEVEDWPGAGRVIVEHLTGTAAFFRPPADPPPKYEFIDSPTFAAGDYRLEWLVKHAMVKREPACIGGPTKTIKTNIAVDLCVSLATGTKFLNHFDVPRPVRVAIASGESGRATLQETFRRVCRSKGVDPAGVGDRLHWCFDLPTLSDPADVGAFVEPLVARQAEVVLIDPLYLCLGPDVDEKSMFKMGSVLKVVGKDLINRGIQPCLVHHANRQIEKYEPMELRHLAYSGVDQFTRQFLLLNRREPYEHDGHHRLWLVVGGSAGFTGKYPLDIVEGVQTEDFTGRVWEPNVANVAVLKEQRETRKAEGKTRQKKEDETLVLKSIDSLVTRGKAPTVNRIRDHNGLSDDRAKGALGRLLDDDILIVSTEKVAIGSKATRGAEVYRRKGPTEPFGTLDAFADAPEGHHPSADHHPPDPHIGGPGVQADGGGASEPPRKLKPKKKLSRDGRTGWSPGVSTDRRTGRKGREVGKKLKRGG
jgi:hypothetical protein